MLESRGRADAEIEAWHHAFGLGIRKHPTTSLLIDHIRSEQHKTELKMRRILKGECNTKKKEIDLAIKSLVTDFAKYELLEFLYLLEIQLQHDSDSVTDNDFDDIINRVAQL